MGLVMDIDQTRSLHDKLHDSGIVLDMTKPIRVPLAPLPTAPGEVHFHAEIIMPALGTRALDRPRRRPIRPGP